MLLKNERRKIDNRQIPEFNENNIDNSNDNFISFFAAAAAVFGVCVFFWAAGNERKQQKKLHI